MLFQQYLNGLTLGSIDAPIALDYTIVFGIVKFINFTRGEIYLIGAYLAIISLGQLGQWGSDALTLTPLIVLVFATIYATAYGATIEKITYKRLRNAPRLSPFISALGV